MCCADKRISIILFNSFLAQEKALSVLKLLQNYPELPSWTLPQDCRHLKKYTHRAFARNIQYLASEIKNAKSTGGEVFYSADDVNKRGRQVKVDTITVTDKVDGKNRKRDFTTGCHLMARKDEVAQRFTLEHIKNMLSSVSETPIEWEDFTAFCADREPAQMAAMIDALGSHKFYGCHAHLTLKSEKLVAEVLQTEEVKAATSKLSLYPMNSYLKSNTTKTVTIMHAYRKLLSTSFSNLTYNVSGDITHDIKIISAGSDRFGATSTNATLLLMQRDKISDYLETITATGIVEAVSSYNRCPWLWVACGLYAVSAYEFTIYLMKKLNLKIDNSILVSFFGDDRFQFDKDDKGCSYNEITRWMQSFKPGYEFKNVP